MDIKRLLESHREIDHGIDLKLEEIAQLRSLAERCTIRITGETRSACPASDKVGRNAAKIADLENKIDADIDRLVDLKEKLLDIAAALGDENERVIIERHYILHESFEAIAEKLGYTPRHVHRLHRSALAHLEELFGGQDIPA
jgi:DNA-directed RNA polymerase specialized sigma subunit